jgi:uncharacterized protein (TIGR00369 family)
VKITEKDKANKCFACGSENPIGLKPYFEFEDGKARGEFVPQEVHQSWIGVFHGGLMATLLDEAIGYAIYFHGIRGLTAKMDVRYRKPALTGEKLFLTGEILRRKGHFVEVQATADLADGSRVAEAVAMVRDTGSKMPKDY